MIWNLFLDIVGCGIYLINTSVQFKVWLSDITSENISPKESFQFFDWHWFPRMVSAMWQIVRVCFIILTCLQVGLIHNILEQSVRKSSRKSAGRLLSSCAAVFQGPAVAVKGILFGCQPASLARGSVHDYNYRNYRNIYYRNIYNYHKIYVFIVAVWCEEYFLLSFPLCTDNRLYHL